MLLIHGESAKGTPLLLAAITPIEIAILLMGNGYANFFRGGKMFCCIFFFFLKMLKNGKGKEEFHRLQTEFHITI